MLSDAARADHASRTARPKSNAISCYTEHTAAATVLHNAKYAACPREALAQGWQCFLMLLREISFLCRGRREGHMHEWCLLVTGC